MSFKKIASASKSSNNTKKCDEYIKTSYFKSAAYNKKTNIQNYCGIETVILNNEIWMGNDKYLWRK